MINSIHFLPNTKLETFMQGSQGGSTVGMPGIVVVVVVVAAVVAVVAVVICGCHH